MYVELTGSPGTGKSYVANSSPAGLSLEYPLNNRFLLILLELLAIPLLLVSVRPRLLLYCVKASFSADRRMYFKLNVFRNTAKKLVFFRGAQITRVARVRVDEGVSHLPFLYGLTGEKEFVYFCDLFAGHLAKIHLIQVCSSDSLIKSRVLTRGHRRLDGEGAEQVQKFFVQNELVANNVSKIMSQYVASYKVIEN